MNATKSLVLFAVLCTAVTCPAQPQANAQLKSYTIVDRITPRQVWFRWFWVILP